MVCAMRIKIPCHFLSAQSLKWGIFELQYNTMDKSDAMIKWSPVYMTSDHPRLHAFLNPKCVDHPRFQAFLNPKCVEV